MLKKIKSWFAGKEHVCKCQLKTEEEEYLELKAAWESYFNISEEEKQKYADEAMALYQKMTTGRQFTTEIDGKTIIINIPRENDPHLTIAYPCAFGPYGCYSAPCSCDRYYAKYLRLKDKYD